MPPFYDSMIGKLIVHGSDHTDALRRAADALANFQIGGITTNLDFQAAVIAYPDFADNDFNTRWLESTFLSVFNAGR